MHAVVRSNSNSHLREDLSLKCVEELLCESLLCLEPLGQHGYKSGNFAEAQHDAMAGEVSQMAAAIEWQQAGFGGRGKVDIPYNYQASR